MTNPTALYWHVFTSFDAERALYSYMTVGEVPIGADDEVAPGVLLRDVVFPVSSVIDGGYAEISGYTYAATFDHEPTTAELDTLAPEGHRSWEQDTTTEPTAGETPA